jgi:hypothetical protein
MQHDASALEPRCRLQHEDSDEYGPPITPETAVADAIAERTQAHLRAIGGAAVSRKPIVMRAECVFVLWLLHFCFFLVLLCFALLYFCVGSHRHSPHTTHKNKSLKFKKQGTRSAPT